MWDGVLHNQCVQDTDADQVMGEAEEDQVMAVMVDVVEMDQLETNTREKEVYARHMEDKIEIQRKSGNLTLKEMD